MNKKEISKELKVSVLKKIVKDADINLRVISSSNDDKWLVVEDMEDSFMYIAIPKSEEGIDKAIRLLEKAKSELLKK